MHKFTCALAFFLFISSVFASGDAPQLASSLSAVVEMQGMVTATGGEINSLQMNVSVPSSTPYQIVEAGEMMNFDSNGNSHITISSANPPNPFTYSKRITVQSVARTTPSLPESYVVPSDFKQFISATSRTQSDDAGIRKLAQNITAGAETPFEKVALLAIYVNKNMKYQENMVGQEKDALWVKQNMYGVCTEYSTLFAALARSIGIPVRYISGYVYSDKFSSWMGHSWTEAYVGKWVPVDPTWFEVGALDAMHIEESRYSEFLHNDALSASVSRSGVELEWDTGEKSGAMAGNIKTIKATYEAPLSNFIIEPVARDLAAGDTTIAYLAINGTDYRVIPLSLVGCVGTASVLLDESERYMILEPGKTFTMVWQLNTSSSLPSNYIYSCPITLNSPYLERRTITIGIDPSKQSSPTFEASLHESEMLPGQENLAFLNIPRSLRGKKFMAVLPDGVFSTVADDTSVELPFSTQSSGNVPVYVAGESGGVELLEYSSGASSGVDISSFSVPAMLVAGKPALAQANISASAYPVEITLDFSFGDQSQQIVGKLSALSAFTFNFTPDMPGTFTARLTASSKDSSSSENQFTMVAAAPTLSLDKAETFYANGTLYTTISFLQTGEPRSQQVSVAGSTYSAATPLVLALPFGTHSLAFSWSDEAGNSYSSSEQITVSQPGPLSSAPMPSCPLSSALLFTVLIFSASATGASALKVR